MHAHADREGSRKRNQGGGFAPPQGAVSAVEGPERTVRMPAAPAPAAEPAEPTGQIDADTVRASVATLRRELGAVFYTNKEKVNEVLRGKSRRELTAIRTEYRAHYGADLDADLRKQLSGDALTEAEASLSGDRARSYVTALQNAGGLQDRASIRGILEGVQQIQSTAERNSVLAEIRKHFPAQYQAVKAAAAQDRDAKVLGALLDGDFAAAEAWKIDGKLHGGLAGRGGFLGLGIGIDTAEILDAFERTVDPDARQELLRKYGAETGRDLEKELQTRLSGTDADLAAAILRGDGDAAAAARIKAASGRLLGTDTETIFRQLEGDVVGRDGALLAPARQKAHQARILRAFDRQYGGKNGENGFDKRIATRMEGLDAERLAQLRSDGLSSDAMRIKYALKRHLFIDRDAIKDVLRGKSRPEIERLAAQVRDLGHEDLQSALEGASGKAGWLGGGRDGFEIRQLLKGEPQTVAEKFERVSALYDFERGDGSSWLGRKTLDLVSRTGRDLDWQQQRIRALQGYTWDGLSFGLADERELAALVGYQAADVDAYRQAKDAATTPVAVGSALTAGAVATAASGGAAGPVTAAVLGGLLGGTAGAAAKVTLQGAGYAARDLGRDLAETGITAATAGIGQTAALARGMNALLKVGPAGGGIVKEAAKGSILGAASATAGAVTGEALRAENHLGEGVFAEKYLRSTGHAILSGAAGGAMGGAVGGKLAPGLGKGSPVIAGSLAGAAAGIGSGLAEGAVKGELQLDWQRALVGAVSGGTSAHQTESYRRAWAGSKAPAPAPIQRDPQWRGRAGLLYHGHHEGGARAHMDQIQALHLSPTDTYQVNNARIAVGRPFTVGGGRIGAFITVEVNGKKHLWPVYSSRSQGIFRLLPGVNGKLSGFPGYDKAGASNILSVPAQIEEILAKKLLAKQVTELPDAQGKALLGDAVPYNVDHPAYYATREHPSYVNKHVRNEQLLAPAKRPVVLERMEKSIRHPRDNKLANPQQGPDFAHMRRAYKTVTATSGEVDAMVFPSKDGTREYTVMRDGEGRAWFSKVASPDAPITPHGVHAQASDVGGMVMPLWEYDDQIPSAYRGEKNPRNADYSSAEKYLARNPYLTEFKAAYAERNRPQQRVSAYTLALLQQTAQELRPAQKAKKKTNRQPRAGKLGPG